MTDVAREKYVRLMAEIEELEDLVAELEKAEAAGGGPGDRHDEESRTRDLEDAREKLAERMFELARVTDACRKIHVKR